MTFAVRRISLQFSTANNKVTNLEGLRASAIILSAGGANPSAQLQMRVYGMTLEQMNQFSAAGSTFVAQQQINITVLAGDEKGVIGQIFAGGIFSSYIDFASVPEVSFVVTAQAGMYERATPAAPNSWAGAQNAEDLIASLAKTIGFTFNNPQNVHAVVQNQYVYGSPMEQILKIIRAVSFASSIENNTITIYPNDGTRDNKIINISPQNGLVGYPTYYESGFIIKSEYNPEMLIGRKINLTSQSPKANGEWVIFEATHEISSLTPDGPWFTTVKLGNQGTISVSPN